MLIVESMLRDEVLRLYRVTLCYLFYCLPGSVTLDELMTGLMSAHETFQQAMDIEIREEVNRLLNLLLKPEN